MKHEAALAAKQIKQILKKEFPSINFSVTSENYAGGNSVRINYTDGVPSKQVDKLVAKFQYGHFDGMNDIYEFSNTREDIPQAKFVQVQRDISPEVRQSIKTKIANDFGIKNENDEQQWYEKFSCWSDQVIWRELSELTV